jgi:hypothetical protein
MMGFWPPHTWRKRRAPSYSNLNIEWTLTIFASNLAALSVVTSHAKEHFSNQNEQNDNNRQLQPERSMFLRDRAASNSIYHLQEKLRQPSTSCPYLRGGLSSLLGRDQQEVVQEWGGTQRCTRRRRLCHMSLNFETFTFTLQASMNTHGASASFLSRAFGDVRYMIILDSFPQTQRLRAIKSRNIVDSFDKTKALPLNTIPGNPIHEAISLEHSTLG